MDTTPGSGFFLFGGHYDGVFGSTLCIDLGTLFYEDVVYDVIVFGDDGYTRFYFQCGAILHFVFSGQVVGFSFCQSLAGGYFTFQLFNSLFGYTAFQCPALCPVITCGYCTLIGGLSEETVVAQVFPAFDSTYIAVGEHDAIIDDIVVTVFGEFIGRIDTFLAAYVRGQCDVLQLGATIHQSIFCFCSFGGEALPFAFYNGVVDFCLCTGTQADTLLRLSVTYQCQVGKCGAGYGRCTEALAVVVALHQAVAVVSQFVFGALVSYEELCFAVPAFGPVERVVATVGRYQILHIDGTTEPFETIIGTHVCLAILYRCPVSYTVEGDTVGFVLFVEGKSGVLYTNIPQCTGIVGVIIATIGCAAYFRATCSAFGIGVCVSADVDTAPCARFFLFGSHHDRVAGSALCIYLGSLFYEDVVYHIVMFGNNGDACGNLQCGTILYVYAAT